jgi:hypothetical protein
MALVRVFSPQSESEVLVATALLDARNIPTFVHNRGIASMLPGIQINAYNTQSIMVPEEHAADAIELLAELKNPVSAAPAAALPLRDRIRIVLEGLLFGWFVPGSRVRRRSSADDLPPNTSFERTREG